MSQIFWIVYHEESKLYDLEDRWGVIYTDKDINNVVSYAKERFPNGRILYENGTPIDCGDG